MKKFIKWLAGILAGILVGYGAWFFTQPPANTTFEGMVYSGTAPVARAMVALQFADSGPNAGPFHDITDENGAYRFEFAGRSKPGKAVFRVSADGYRDLGPQPYAANVSLDNRMDFALDRLAAMAGSGPGATPAQPPPPAPSTSTAQPPPGGAGSSAPSGPAIKAAQRAPIYVKKPIQRAMLYRLQ